MQTIEEAWTGVQSCGNGDPTCYFGTATCPAGEVLTGGGVYFDTPGINLDRVLDSFPNAGNQWFADVDLANASDSFNVYAICVTGTSSLVSLSSGPNSNGRVSSGRVAKAKPA